MDNELRIWKYTYRKSYYLTHPWKFFKDTYWNFRNWWHRANYGFAYVDVWEWGSWWPRVGAEALRYMAKHGSGYPGAEPWETPEKWRNHLLNLADGLDWCANSLEWDTHEKLNEYYEAFKGIQERSRRERYTDTGDKYVWYEESPEDKELRKKYWEKENEIIAREDQERSEIFAEIGKNLGRYFD